MTMSGALVALALVHGAAALLVPLPPSAPLVRAAVAPAAASVASYPSPFPVSSVTLTLSNEEAPSCADTRVPEPPYCTYGRRVPASCVLHVPRAQGGLPRAPRCVPRTVATVKNKVSCGMCYPTIYLSTHL